MLHVLPATYSIASHLLTASLDSASMGIGAIAVFAAFILTLVGYMLFRRAKWRPPPEQPPGADYDRLLCARLVSAVRNASQSVGLEVQLEREIRRSQYSQVIDSIELKTGRPIVVKLFFESGPTDPVKPSSSVELVLAGQRRLKPGLTAEPLGQFSIQLDQPNRSSVRHALVMERLEGPTFQQLVDRGQIGAQQAISWLVQAAKKLAEIHEAGIVHGDISTSNLMFSDAACTDLRIIDFSTALLDAAPTPPQPVPVEEDKAPSQRRAVGTPCYLAPEMAAGGPATRRADIYSLGCVAFHVIVGQPPFLGATPLEILWKQMHSPLELPDSPALAPDLRSLLTRWLAKAPDHRPVTMREIAEVLEAVRL